MLAAYTYHEPLTFSGWLDLETGQTLHAEPGQTYDIAPASGNPADDVPSPWFTPAESSEDEAVPEAETEAPQPEPGPEPENPDGEPGTEPGEPQQF